MSLILKTKFFLLILLFSGCDAHLDLEGQRHLRRELVFHEEKNSNVLWLRSRQYAIASDSVEASAAGARILAAGGNLVDSAVAVSFAISVVRPQSTGLGGGGFLLLHLNGKTRAFDFRERAPLTAHRDMYRKKPRDSLFGPRSVAVPGTVAGLLAIHKKYGQLSLAQVVAPAVRLAEEGFVVYPDLAQAIDAAYEDMDPAMRVVFAPNGKRYKPKDILIQKDLARSLRLIAKEGAAAFYKGQIAQSLTDTMQKRGGLIRPADLRRYRLFSPDPLWSEYRGLRIATMPPPSSGVFLLSMLKMLEPFPLRRLYQNQRERYYHLLVQAMAKGYRDRARYGGDSRFFSIPVRKLLSPPPLLSKPKARQQRLALIGSRSLHDSYETTHISLMDHKGNAVVSTQSINYRFGARIMIPGWGIVLNDTMDDFSAAPGKPNVYGLVGGQANAIAPGKTPLSSMSPSLLFDAKGVYLALGAPGGSQIITAILQTILNDVDLKHHPFASVARGRIHHQYKPPGVIVEAQALSGQERRRLGERGYDVQVKPLRAKVFLVKRDGHSLVGVSDPRGNGQPTGSENE